VFYGTSSIGIGVNFKVYWGPFTQGNWSNIGGGDLEIHRTVVKETENGTYQYYMCDEQSGYCKVSSTDVGHHDIRSGRKEDPPEKALEVNSIQGTHYVFPVLVLAPKFLQRLDTQCHESVIRRTALSVLHVHVSHFIAFIVLGGHNS